MSVVQKAGRLFSSSLLKISLFVFAVAMALNSAIGSPKPVLEELDKSSVYKNIVPELLEEASQKQREQDRQELPINDPEVQEIIKAAFSPMFIEDSAGKVVHGFYAWLDGTTEEPQFKIDLSGPRQSLIYGLADYAKQRMLSLPPCTAAQLRALATQEIDPFTIECQPPFVLSVERQELIDQLSASEILRDQEITSAMLVEGNPDLFTKELKDLPGGYQLLKNLPLISLALALASAVALMLLHDDKRRGLRQAGGIVLVTGLLLLVSILVYQFAFERLAAPARFNIESAALRYSVVDFLGRLFGRFSDTLLVISGVCLAISGGILGTLALTSRKKWTAGKRAKIN